LLLLGSAAEDKKEREEAEESISLLEEGFLPALPVAAKGREREMPMLDLLGAVVFTLLASSAT
jgi:hypothetical protein